MWFPLHHFCCNLLKKLFFPSPNAGNTRDELFGHHFSEWQSLKVRAQHIDIAEDISNDFTFECMPPQSDLPVTSIIQLNILYMIEMNIFVSVFHLYAALYVLLTLVLLHFLPRNMTPISETTVPPWWCTWYHWDSHHVGIELYQGKPLSDHFEETRHQSFQV